MPENPVAAPLAELPPPLSPTPPSMAAAAPVAGTPAGATPDAEAQDGEPRDGASGVAAPRVAAPQVDCTQQLKRLFPALFTGAVRPLKLRIQLDIQARAPGQFTKQALSAFFRRYTGSTSYLMAVAKASQRFDLDGQPAGELSEEHRQVAQTELARRRAVQDERRALLEQQRRNRAGLLRDFETTTLTRANFCVLKAVAPEELDGLLELARSEAQERARPELGVDRSRRSGPAEAPPRHRARHAR